MPCIVTRQFSGPGDRVYHIGEVVNTDEWLHGDKLVRQRYLRLATPEELTRVEVTEPPFEAPKPPRRGRRH